MQSQLEKYLTLLIVLISVMLTIQVLIFFYIAEHFLVV
jgi:hypothetical protein